MLIETQVEFFNEKHETVIASAALPHLRRGDRFGLETPYGEWVHVVVQAGYLSASQKSLTQHVFCSEDMGVK